MQLKAGQPKNHGGGEGLNSAQLNRLPGRGMMGGMVQHTEVGHVAGNKGGWDLRLQLKRRANRLWAVQQR